MTIKYFSVERNDVSLVSSIVSSHSPYAWKTTAVAVLGLPRTHCASGTMSNDFDFSGGISVVTRLGLVGMRQTSKIPYRCSRSNWL